jgi:glyoxylase-like metal-dependent hydrolase (beta-lactamase superfamily II)
VPSSSATDPAGRSVAIPPIPIPDAAAREVLAVRYGHRRTTRAEMYLNFRRYGEPDAELGLDYYFWVIAGQDGVILVDTGFAAAAGQRRGRTRHATPADALPALGLDPAAVTAVVITHAHWDHIGNVGQFPRAELVMTEAEYRFWTSPLATRGHFAAETEPDELASLERAYADGRLTLFRRQLTLAPGVELIEVGGHTPGQLIVTAAASAPGAGAAGGRRPVTAVLASDALHFYEEAEQDRPFAIVAHLPDLYRGYDLLNDLARQPGTHLVAGHDPLVRQRFAPHPTGRDVTDLGAPLSRPPDAAHH